MKKTLKRIFASLMVVVMVLTAAPLSGLVGLELNLDWLNFNTNASAATYSGECGDNVTWTLYDDGELVISGSGAMKDYSSSSNVPWHSVRESITKVTINKGIRSIGDYSFTYCEKLVNVSIPYGVSIIGKDAFCCCHSLTNVTLPNSVTILGNGAFYYCDSLNNIIIPNSVTTIEGWAFYACHGLKSINIPYSVTYIGDDVFRNCSNIESITVDKANSIYSNDSFGVLFNKNRTMLIKYPKGNKRTHYVIPNSVESISYDAFENCYFLKSVTIPNNVISIGDTAFHNCDSITSILIPDSVTTIGMGAFGDCNGLSTVTIGKGVTTIGEWAFFGCNNLTNVYYTGTQEQWSKISIGSYNDRLFNATIHFNSNSDQPSSGNNTITINAYNDYSYCTYIGENRISREGSDSYVSMGMVTFDSNKISDISKELTWSSSDESILRIIGCNYSKFSDGQYFMEPEITALTKGNVTITVTASNGATQSWDVTVYPNEYYLRVCSTDADCSTRVGESITLEVALCKNGSIVKDWKKPAIVIGNGEVIDVTSPYAMNSYKGDYFRYEIDIIGLKKGKSSLTITDMDSGANVVLTITVGETLVSNISYMADNVPSFYPDVLGDRKTQTNIYNCNNLYVNSYSSYAKTDGYHVSFDVYNESYMHGSVDVFDSTGKWIESHKIAKYEDIQSLYDTGKALVFLVAELNKPISYTNHMHSVKTHISIDIPNGGYFTISNNYAQSPGAFIYNSVDYMMLAAETAIDLVVNGVEIDAIAQNVVEQAINSDTMMEVFMKGFHNIALSVSQTALEAGYGEAASALTINAKNIYDSAGISFEGAVETVCGIAEGAFKLATGFIGATLEGLFVFQKMSSYTMQTVELCNSVNKPYITIHSPKQKESTTINGVTVTDANNAVDSKTVLQVFRIHNDEVLNITLNRENYGFDDYVLYNISFVKNDKEVQPNGRVTVKIPVPDGYSYENSTVLKETDDGWEIINAVCENGFFVFEVNHFCNFAIVKQGKVNSVSINNISMNYKDSTTITPSVNADAGVKYTVSYSSSDESVARVDSNGNVTATGKGNATITVTVTDDYGNTVTDTCNVEVKYSWWQWIIVIVLFGWIWY